jgi:lipopolysaccharide/colanic/teichoic acid biosynthesis glycosyltransferase
MTERATVFTGRTLDTLEPQPPTAQRRIKAAAEWTVAAAALILCLPLAVSIAAAVALTSRGPIVHRRRVLGRNGVPFDAFKFRTMVDGADAVLNGSTALREQFARRFKLHDDPRVTPVGRILRRSSLDELPQLVNVLRGEMALVGPRMISPEELSKYGTCQARLLSIRPGMTGLWQTSGRQRTSYDERVRLDMEYIDRWNLWLDARILMKTIKVVVTAEGAY